MTLINVATVVLVHRQSVPVSTLAEERAQIVAATPISAQKGHHVALVNVDAIVAVAELEAGVAVAFVAAHEVDAGAVVADVWVTHAFVYNGRQMSNGVGKPSGAYRCRRSCRATR